MLKELAYRYLPALDAEMRRVIDSAPVETPGYGVQLRYPLGWVTEDGTPYEHSTGKRIRPILLLLCAEAAGGNWEAALPAAAAVELLHNFSLIHDDIQDNSLTRHGRPTVWQIWGRANAINAGDAMFALSYDALATLVDKGVPAEIVVDAWRIYNRTTVELTRGQHLDMRFETQQNVSVDEYISMISGKTAALLAGCAEMGALIGSLNRETAKHFADFGLNIGIAFQIRDDILGIWGDPELTGKSAATDIVSRKKSLPVLYGLANNAELVALYESETFEEAHVEQAVALLDTVNARGYAEAEEKRYYEKAFASLQLANPQGEGAQGLNGLVDALFNRVY